MAAPAQGGGASTLLKGMPLWAFRVVFTLSMCRHRGTMKDGIANNSTASISQARKAVEQLKMEACMDRIKVQGFCLSVPQSKYVHVFLF